MVQVKEGVIPLIRPEDVTGEKRELIPAIVLQSFNTLIAQNFNGDSSRFRQDDIVEILVDGGLDRAEIFAKHWLDVEDLYREVGWNVEYDKPGYNEGYSATFTFKPSRRETH